MIKKLERLQNTVNKYMADIRPDRLTTDLSDIWKETTNQRRVKLT
jgi:hypothetical protein